MKYAKAIDEKTKCLKKTCNKEINMSFIKKILNKYIILAADMAGYTLLKIMTLYEPIAKLLKNGWNESAYENLEVIRKIAESEKHWFEELWILIYEAQVLIEFHKDPDLFYAVNNRLIELQEIFDMPDEEFTVEFERYYIKRKNRKLQKHTYDYLVKFHTGFYTTADYMSVHLNYLAGILCSKAMGKIEKLTGNIPLSDRMERLFKMAIDYGNIRKFDEAMAYYNEAITTAREEKDMTYEYIAIMRKLSVCLVSRHMDNHFDFDTETITSIDRLYEMCEGNHPNPYSLGDCLVKTEQEKAEKGTEAEKKDAKWRIDRIQECMPILHFQLALRQGDWQSAIAYGIELKEKEMKVYGSTSGNSNVDFMFSLYAKLNNSIEMLESVEEETDEDAEDDDEPYPLNLQEGTWPVNNFRILQNVALSERQKKHHLAAMYLYLQADNIANEMYSDYHSAMSRLLIAKTYAENGKKEEALKWYQHVLKMFTEAHYGSDVVLSQFPRIVTHLDIGNILKEDNPKEAIHVLTEGIDLFSCKNSDDRFFLERLLLARAASQAKLGIIDGKEKDCMEALSLIIEEIRERLPYIDKEVRENYWGNLLELLGMAVAQVDRTSSDKFRIAVYDVILMAKGFLLSSEKAEKKAIYGEESLHGYIPLYKELEEYESSKPQWGTMTENSADEYVEHYMKTMKLQMATNEVIEKYYDFMHIKYDTTSNKLSDQDVVLDYFDYSLENGDLQYVAIVYKKGSSAPEFIKACKESEIKNVYNDVASRKYDDGTAFHISEAYNPVWKYSFQLFGLILNSVLQKVELPQNSIIHFIPTGSLHKIPVESLVAEEGTDTIVSEFYAGFSRISHARFLQDSHENKFNNIALFGGLNYGEASMEDSHERGYALDMNESDPSPLAPWGELKQSLSEIKSISFLWKMTKGEDAEICTGFDGTPENLKNLSGKGFSIIHLATHGFFETKKTKVNIPGLQGAYRPMDLTGVIMSNGNEGWLHGNSLHHEGILTATDISKMDLDRTELVVLSACHTGAGIVRSDGVFGLQRSFKKAGAKSLIMSLWNESDEVGFQFMKSFYSHLLSKNKSILESFQLARQEVRKRYTHPFFWANFILLD